VCSITGAAGSTVDCPLMIARGGEFLNGPAGLQFVLNYDADSVTFDTFYDESCFPDPIGCLDLAVAGPGAQTLSTGHTVSILPLSPVDWAGESCSGPGTCADPQKACIDGFCEGTKGAGAVVIVNLANPTALISDAYLENGAVVGDPTFMTAKFVIDADLGGGAVELLISKITAAQQSSENMSTTVQDGMIIAFP